MRLTAESEMPIFQYSDGAAGGARGRARAEEGAQEGAHGGRGCGRAVGAPMLSAALRVADVVYYTMRPSLPASALPGRCAPDHSAGRQRA